LRFSPIVVDSDGGGAHHVEAHLYNIVNVMRVVNLTAMQKI